MSISRKVDFERYVDPFLPAEPQQDEFANDNEWAFARRTTLAAGEPKPTPYVGYFVQSNVHGFVPLGEHNLVSKRRKRWVAHTTFRLTGADKDAVCGVDGVDGFSEASPYSFLVDVGWMFPDAAVLGTIRERLCEPAPGPEPAAPPPADPIEQASGLFKFWAVVRAGKAREVVGGLTREEVEGKLKVRGLAAEKTSWTR
jgi:hypothetical protein